MQGGEKSALHYFDFKTGNHAGLLPLTQGVYWQKNYNFQLESIEALLHFENREIDICNITARSEGLIFEGEVKVTLHSREDIDLIIAAQRVFGTINGGQKFISHFNPSLFWRLPIEGQIACENNPFFSTTILLHQLPSLKERCMPTYLVHRSLLSWTFPIVMLHSIMIVRVKSSFSVQQME